MNYDELGMSAYPTNENRMLSQTVFFSQVMFIYVEAHLNENYISVKMQNKHSLR